MIAQAWKESRHSSYFQGKFEANNVLNRPESTTLLLVAERTFKLAKMFNKQTQNGRGSVKYYKSQVSIKVFWWNADDDPYEMNMFYAKLHRVNAQSSVLYL